MDSVGITRVLVPVALCDPEEDPNAERIDLGDGPVGVSRPTIAAVELAARIVAGSEGAEVRLLHCTPKFDQGRVYSGAARQSMLGSALEEVQREAKANSIATLKIVAERWASAVNTTEVARSGSSVSLILDEASAFEAEMIVIATSSRGAVARFFLGSTADRVIREAQCPVLVIPAGG